MSSTSRTDEGRERDLLVVESLRRAHADRVSMARVGRIAEALDPSDAAGGSTYVVKILDVTAGLGKVAGRRLLGRLGVEAFATVADLDDLTRAAIVRECLDPTSQTHDRIHAEEGRR